MLTILLTAAFVGALGLAAVTDLRTRRIPNLLTVSALAVALVLRAALGGGALLDGLAGVGIAMLVMLPLFALRGVGGGDAKLMMVVGAFLGPKGFLVALLATALVGGAMSVIAAARAGVLLPVLYNTGDLAKNLVTLGRRGERVTLASPGALSVPYGVAIALGSVTALFLGGGIL
jgi:prepilin peptidase CpaA